ncbi:MFS transporter [Erythrobacter insulae]|uniref:MFS transporter n=1 Tax=Erythrobacter insulae TaxID=2584124 RepID=A0A547PCD1_9SPHN|nr:MFS transporter [Erythrobacter insulae]TRD11807.1 MFS transporter [Erythrobacter insulae]
MSDHAAPDDRQPFWFLILFALAVGGGAVAYVPLLTVLLPVKITGVVGAEDVASLARATFYGAIVASLANIAFGMVSDRSGTRRIWIVLGLFSSSALLIFIGRANSLFDLIVLIMAWQVCLNMMLGPLLAWAGDCVPDRQKGLLGGLLSAAPAMGAMAGSLVTFENFVSESFRMPAIAMLVAALVLPVVLLGGGRERPALMRPRGVNDSKSAPYADAQAGVQADAQAGAQADAQDGQTKSVVARMWMSRFLVQISEAGLFAFLLFWLRSIVADFHENTAANIFSLVLIVSVPLSLVIGRWSDTHRRPLLPLVGSAMLAAAGLAIMAAALELPLAITGYVIFGIAASIFLSLHTSQTLRVLPKPQHRGRDLGIFNLTNTIPSVVMPWITLSLVPGFGFSALFILFAGLAALAALLLATIIRRT